MTRPTSSHRSTAGAPARLNESIAAAIAVAALMTIFVGLRMAGSGEAADSVMLQSPAVVQSADYSADWAEFPGRPR